MRHSGTASASFYYFYPILWALRKCLWHDHYNWAMTYQSVLKAEFLIMFITHLSSCHFHILKCSSTVFQKICAFTLNQTHNWPLVKSIQITHNYSVAWLFHDRHGARGWIRWQSQTCRFKIRLDLNPENLFPRMALPNNWNHFLYSGYTSNLDE